MNRLITFVAAISIITNAFAQSPDKLSYQAVIRNSSNALVTNQAIGMQISILQGSATGSAVYVETQTPTTNASGLVSAEIGNGTVVSGSFSSINWSNGPYFIKSETDPAGGTNYSITGTSQLLSVPYAIHAKTAENVQWTATGNNINNSNSGNVGIGTTTPSTAKLVVSTPAGQQGLDLSSSDSYANMRVIQNSNGSTDKDIYLGYNSGTNSALHLYSNNTETVTVTGGSVGVGTSTPNAGAVLDISSNSKAVMLPRLTTSQRNAITPSPGMMIYNTDENRFQGYANSGCMEDILHNNTGMIGSSTSVGTDGIGVPNYAGQSFIPQNCSGTLQSFVVHVSNPSTSTVSVSVYSGAGYGGTLLGSINTALTTAGAFTINLSSLNINLQAGNTYSIRLYSAADFSACPSISTMNNSFGTNATYPNGTYLDYQGTPSSNEDMWFEVHITSPGAPTWVNLH